MSNDQIDEYEQGERVRKWLRDNGASVFGGIALGLAAIVGFQLYQTQGDSHRAEASMQFERFVEAEDAGNAESAAAIAGSLVTEYADTPYPALAALRLAASQLRAGKPEEALQAIEAGLPTARDAALRQMLLLRAARAELVLARHDAALARLTGVTLPAYAALRHEIEGDALAAQGRREEARAAYQNALTALDVASPLRGLLELKLADVGGTAQRATEA